MDKEIRDAVTIRHTVNKKIVETDIDLNKVSTMNYFDGKLYITMGPIRKDRENQIGLVCTEEEADRVRKLYLKKQ